MRRSYIREKKYQCGDEYMTVGVYAVTDQEHRQRGKKRKESDRGQKERNKYASLRRKQRKVLANFDKNGFFLTGTYEDGYLPADFAACRKDVENYKRRVITATCKRFGVPESTIRSWMAEEAKQPDGAFAQARAEAAREIAARAALGARAQVGYLQQRVAENQRAADIRAKLEQRLDEDARSRRYEIGGLLKSEAEDLQDAAETGLVVRSAPGTYDRQLSDEERDELAKQLERYEAKAMTDKDAANIAAVLLTTAANAAALVPRDEGSSQSVAPAVLMEGQEVSERQEVVLDGSGNV